MVIMLQQHAIKILRACLLAVFLLQLTAGSVLARDEYTEKHFRLRDTNGYTYDSKAVIGKKPLLIIFSATWCPACNKYIPVFKQLYANFSSKGLEIISIDISEPKKKVMEWAAKNKIPYRVLVDENGSVGDNYRIFGVPTMVLLDKAGRVICNPCQSTAEVEKMFQRRK